MDKEELVSGRNKESGLHIVSIIHSLLLLRPQRLNREIKASGREWAVTLKMICDLPFSPTLIRQLAITNIAVISDHIKTVFNREGEREREREGKKKKN